jgi:uncharacterized protein YjdB
MRTLTTFLTVSLISASVACEDDDGPFGRDDDVATVEITTAAPTLEAGTAAVQLAFEIRDADGDLIDPDDVTIDFTTSSATVATVSETGLVTPVGPGTATVTIEVGSVTDTITVTIVPEISSIDIVGADLDLLTGETPALEVTVLDAGGDPVVDPVLRFTSSDPANVSVDNEGNVTAASAGTATVTVEGGGESDSIEITVFTPAIGGISFGGSLFTAQVGDALVINELATVRDAGGVIIPGADLAFETTNAVVATVDAAGMLTALAPGETIVTVTSPDAPLGSAALRLTVLQAGSFDTIQFDPAGPFTISVGATVDLTVLGEFTGDAIIPLAVFSSSDETIATVDPFTGVVTGVAAGTATITATSGTLTADAEITVE